MQQGCQGRPAELKAGAPASRHVPEPDGEQEEDGNGCEDDGEQGELDRLARDGRTNLQDLEHVDGTERGLGREMVLERFLLRRSQWKAGADDEAASVGLNHRSGDGFAATALSTCATVGWLAK